MTACVIDGVAWSIDISSGAFSVMFNLASLDSRTFLVLDDAFIGTLDSTNRLGF